MTWFSVVANGIREIWKGAILVKIKSDHVVAMLETLQTFPIVLRIKFQKFLTWLKGLPSYSGPTSPCTLTLSVPCMY